MKYSLATLAFILSATTFSQASSLWATNAVDVNFTTPDGTALDASYTAKIGYTTLDFSSGMPDYDSIITNWSEAGDIPFPLSFGPGATYNGYFEGNISFTDAAGLAGENVFVWITDGMNQNLVMKSLTVQFLSDVSIPNANALTIEVATLGDFEILLGSYDPSGINLAGTGGSLVLVPEPSAGLFGLLGGLCLLRRRRK